MSRDNKGRRKGSRNKGHFFRDGRGWFTKDKRQRFVPLTDKAGARIKDENAKQAAKDAYARYLVECGNQPKQVAGDGATVGPQRQIVVIEQKRWLWRCHSRKLMTSPQSARSNIEWAAFFCLH